MRHATVKGKRCRKCHGYGILRASVPGVAGRTTKMVMCDRCHGSKIEKEAK